MGPVAVSCILLPVMIVSRLCLLLLACLATISPECRYLRGLLSRSIVMYISYSWIVLGVFHHFCLLAFAYFHESHCMGIIALKAFVVI